MSNSTRRSFLRPSLVVRDRVALAGGAPAAAATSALNRRAFLQSTAGAAAGAAVIVTGPKLAAAALHGASATAPAPVITTPSGPPPAETVMAYLRNAERGEVTVMSGTRETTYLDPALAKRMLDAAR